MVRMVRCPGCGAAVPATDGPTHAYMPSAAGCWQVYGELQADEMRRFGYPPAHGVVVDAWAAQHPGDGADRRDRQSVFIHLVALCAHLERPLRPDARRRLLTTLVRTHEGFPELHRPSGPGALTVLDMIGATNLDDYSRRADAWAAAVWESWSGEHGRIRAALARAARGATGADPG